MPAPQHLERFRLLLRFADAVVLARLRLPRGIELLQTLHPRLDRRSCLVVVSAPAPGERSFDAATVRLGAPLPLANQPPSNAMAAAT